ncbi:hypothetical protein KC207_12315 [Phycicoccus sp. BSK3Z-2]|uniref:YcxB family protein n=1 Tax=Phycicoccus avicenniae TaxID=2828860 RepID=A0A941D8I6_9MICO|nr:hypothetical protein [Phycicoccus avicenniae]MBR7744074.1 hypothetical protein [Phycicoccus avicenniae]
MYEVSYVQTREIARREAAALVERLERRQGRWRWFVVRHAAVLALCVGVVLTLAVAGRASADGAARGLAVLVPAVLALTAFDVWRARRRVRRAARRWSEISCPPGTQVRGRWSAERVTFVLPSHQVALDLSTIVTAERVAGVLVLEQEDERAWTVPDELLGDRGLAILAEALGPRLRGV